MKSNIILFLLGALLLGSCRPTDDEKAQARLQKIEQLFAEGRYQATLDSILKLRADYPKAIEARKRALALWQEASLLMTQQDVGKTDSLLQATTAAIPKESDRFKRNMLGVKRDSLQARYEALCGTVRIIRHKMKAK
ncbi:hypothetical protein [Prevotella sp.]|uniref:hypothetical protein n=1 Tax=Prevotella sp. TaxID=59823 RepID=UPI002F947D41